MKEININLSNVNNRKEFYLEIIKKITKGIEWLDYSSVPNELNLDGLSDFLSGGFGVFELDEKVTIVIDDTEKLKKILGVEETLEWLTSKYKYWESDKNMISRVDNIKRENSTDTLFFIFLDIVTDQKHIKLVLQ